MEKYEALNKFLNNTRRHRRFPVDMMDIRVRTKTEADTSVPSEDYKAISINLGGALMEGEVPHKQESRLLMYVLLPENVRISLTGRVTSCHASKSAGKLYDVGIEFVSMSVPDKAILKKFIHWLYLKDAGFAE